MPLAADADAVYDEVDRDRPFRAGAAGRLPAQPGQRRSPCEPVECIEGRPGLHRQLHQLQLCGSDDAWPRILKGKTVSPERQPCHRPGHPARCWQCWRETARWPTCWHAGARILECACGPCIGMGQSPNSAGVSLRTFNRNFEGRSGTRRRRRLPCKPRDARP